MKKFEKFDYYIATGLESTIFSKCSIGEIYISETLESESTSAMKKIEIQILDCHGEDLQTVQCVFEPGKFPCNFYTDFENIRLEKIRDALIKKMSDIGEGELLSAEVFHIMIQEILDYENSIHLE